MIRLSALLFFALAMVCLPGCGGNKVQGLPTDEQNMKAIALLYGEFSSSKRKPPANLEEFKKYLEATKANPAAVITFEGDVETFLTSPRDKKPYVFIWNVTPQVGKYDPIAYEQEGDGDSRLAAFGGGSVVDLDPEQFKQLVPNAK
ncbi:MAG: hypothetical protein SGJ19_14915 [Planctomycetia bacterium]|nr:hypothetical protein [Planctomycetia bacterium]